MVQVLEFTSVFRAPVPVGKANGRGSGGDIQFHDVIDRASPGPGKKSLLGLLDPNQNQGHFGLDPLEPREKGSKHWISEVICSEGDTIYSVPLRTPLSPK